MLYSKEYEKNLQSLIKKELWNPNLTNPNLNIKKNPNNVKTYANVYEAQS